MSVFDGSYKRWKIKHRPEKRDHDNMIINFFQNKIGFMQVQRSKCV